MTISSTVVLPGAVSTSCSIGVQDVTTVIGQVYVSMLYVVTDPQYLPEQEIGGYNDHPRQSRYGGYF